MHAVVMKWRVWRILNGGGHAIFIMEGWDCKKISRDVCGGSQTGAQTC